MNGSGSILMPGMNDAGNTVRLSGFHSEDAPTDAGGAATLRRLLFWRRFSARALSPTPPSVQYPPAERPHAADWRNPHGTSDAGLFFDEAEAQRLTLAPRGPGLPHHRHPITTDELLAGLIVALVCGGAVVYVLGRLL